MRAIHSTTRVLWLLLAAAWTAGTGCAGTAPAPREAEAQAPMEAETSSDLREKLEALGRDQQAAADRQQDLVERLQRAEKSLAALNQRLAALESPGAPARPVPPTRPDPAPAAVAAPASGDPIDVAAVYSRAREDHKQRRFDEAVAGFSRILEAAPDSDLADNARYWIGEARYLQRRFRPALAEFTKVLSYPYTEKADDAQLMIARSHAALGESDQAAAAFRKLLQNYPGSEYLGEAREELSKLEGP